MPATTPALVAAAAGSGGLTDINLGLTVWTIVLFAIFATVLAKFGWAPLLRLVEEREKGIRESVDGAQRANAEAQVLLEKHKELLREAGRERDELIKRAAKEGEQLRADLAARARNEADQLIERAKQQIERETSQAILELRAQVADLAVEAAGRIVTSSLSPEAQRKLVSDFIEGLPKSQA
jgi:F-type H+-transporting ATPase subunit b